MTKNILYLAPYRQNDGWGLASIDYLNAIMYACQELSYNIKIQPIYFNNSFLTQIPAHIPILEEVDLNHIDTIIQKVLPQAVYIDNRFRNIVLSVFENTNLSKNTSITKPLKLAEKLLVPSKQEVNMLIKSGIKKEKVENILQPIPCEQIDAYKNIFSKNNTDIGGINYKFHDYVKFCFIGTNIKRKNIVNLIKAFKAEVREREKVILIIKSSDKGSLDKQIKNSLGSLRYGGDLSNVLFVEEHLSQESIYNLHYISDFFITASRGEAFCRPIAEAMRFGTIPIAVKNTGACSYMSEDCCYFIDAHEDTSNYNGMQILDHDNELSTDMDPHIISIQEQIRKAIDLFDRKKELEEKQQKCIEITNQLSYEEVGKKICSLDIM